MLPTSPANAEVLVGGMGGSGIAGDFGAALATETEGRVVGPQGVFAAARVGTPGEADRHRCLVLGEHRGDPGPRERSRRCRPADRDRDHRGAAGRPFSPKCLAYDHVPTGLQPRAAVGYLAGAVSRLLGTLGVLPDQTAALDEAADLVDRGHDRGLGNVGRWRMGSPRDWWARVTIVYGGGPISATAAQRWKTQINENAKLPAWWSVLPELDHNEIVGWETLPALTRDVIGIVSLTDIGDHATGSRPPRVTRRDSPRALCRGSERCRSRGDSDLRG